MERTIRIPESAYNTICARLSALEAMADVSLAAPNDLAVGTVETCRDSVYFGLGEVRELLRAAATVEPTP